MDHQVFAIKFENSVQRQLC